jgi:hypothetical protein
MNGIIQWAQQLKNLENQQNQLIQNTSQQLEVTPSQSAANLNALQSDFVLINSVILLFYMAIFLVNKRADRALTLLAFFVSIAIAFTPLYNLLSGMQYHFVFAFIYINLTLVIKQTPVKVAILSMGLFQTLMAWDSLTNATAETFIYTHYEITICLLHSVVIGYFLKSDFIRIKQYIKRIMCNCAMFVRN